MHKIETLKNITLTLLLMILGSCNGQHKQTIENNPKVNTGGKSAINELTKTEEGIVYFSTDNGVTWVNASKGLPQTISIGLGGVSASSNVLGVATKENGVYLFDFKDSVWVNIPADQEMIASNIGAIIFYRNDIYVGTQYGGIFFSNNIGKSWTTKNAGLSNLTVRRFTKIGGKLYVGTNNGLYSYDDASNKWELEYGQSSMQVNGIAESNGIIYIATNQGAFKFEKASEMWEKVYNDWSLHNISSVGKTVYTMSYNELFSSNDNGETWQNIQKGLPKDLYTFNVIGNANTVFAGQWDGIYKKTIPDKDWKPSSKGLPTKFAVTNLIAYNGILVITASEGKLRAGVTIEK